MKKLNKKLVGLGGATLLALCSANVSALPITVIDDFSTKQGNTFGTDFYIDTSIDGNAVGGSVSGAGILGGERDLSIELKSGVFASTGASPGAGIGDGTFHFNNVSNASSTAVIQWDGVDGSMGINTTGLGGVDLTNGGSSSSFLNDIVHSDGGFNFTLTVWDMDGNSVTAILAADEHQTPATSALGFATFSNCDATGTGGVICLDGANNPVLTGVDMTNVGALQLVVDPTGAAIDRDFQIDAIRIPEPSTIALLGAGLIGMGAARRKKATLKA